MTASIIVTDPFQQTRKTYDIPAGANLAQALMDISPSRWDASAIGIYDGAIVSGAEMEVERAARIHVKDGEVYQVVLVPAEPISTGAAIAAFIGVTSTIGIAAITVATYIAIMAITMAISFLATMLLAPGKQTNKALASEDQPSGLNSLVPPRNSFRLGSRVAEIYGTMRFWPDLIFNAVAWWEGVGWEVNIESSVENAQTTSQQHVRAVYCLGRGHFQMQNFQFGDSPVSAANGAVYVYPPGVPLPATVTSTYPVANLSRQELGGPGSVNMWSPWYEIPADEIHSVDVQVQFPAGLINVYSGKKVPPGWVQFMVANISIQGERLEDGFVVETIALERPVRAKTRNELRITFREAVTPGRWRFRVAETNDQQPFPNGNTETMIKKTALEGIIGHRTLTEAERTFENETVLIVEANNIGGTAIQNMESFNLLATRMLPTQDVPGVMTEWRGDNRWITAAINTLTDPVICNYPMSEVDWPSLHAVQASLDAYPDPYPEWRFNAALDRQMTADEQLMLIARKARCYVFPSAGRVTFARDERRTGVSALFNRRNRLLGRSDVGMGMQFAGRDDPDAVVISWINADDGYRQETYTYPEGFTPSSPMTMDLVGAVHKWEVCRRARFEMAQVQYRRRTMPLRVTEEGQLLLPFDRVAIVMPWDEGVQDGEVLEVDGLDLRLSRAAPTGITGTARMRLRAPDGRQTELINVYDNSGRGPDWVTLGYEPSFTILGENADRQLGTLYSISTTEANETATHWLMTGAEIDDQGVAITTMEDADEVYQLSDDLEEPCGGDPPPPEIPECSGVTYYEQWPGEPGAWGDDPAPLGEMVVSDAGTEMLSRFCVSRGSFPNSGSFGNSGDTGSYVATDQAYGSMLEIGWPTFMDQMDALLDPMVGLTPDMVTDYPTWANGFNWPGARPVWRAWAFGLGDFYNSGRLEPGEGTWAPLGFCEGIRTFTNGNDSEDFPSPSPPYGPVVGAWAQVIFCYFWTAAPLPGGFPSTVRIVHRDTTTGGVISQFTGAGVQQIANPNGDGYIVAVTYIVDYSGEVGLWNYTPPEDQWDLVNHPPIVLTDGAMHMIEIHRT